MRFSLDYDSVYVNPIHVDWGCLEVEDYSYYNHAVCGHCDEEFVIEGESEILEGEHKAGCKMLEDGSDLHLKEDSPAMNTLWPIVGEYDPQSLARNLKHLAICVVVNHNGDVFGPELGFGLTGGGMDMSNDIILAYARNGIAPPACLEWPHFADTAYTKDVKLGIRAIRSSYRCTEVRAYNKKRILRKYVAEITERTKNAKSKRAHSGSVENNPA